MGFKLSKFAGLLMVSVLISSDASAATAFTSAGTGYWSDPVTWGNSVGAGVPGTNIPGAADTVIIAAGHTVTVDAAASTANLAVHATGTLNFSGAFTLDVGAVGIQNAGTFDATNAGAISSAATNVGRSAIYNDIGATFTMGSGALTLSAVPSANVINNNGTFTSGSALVSVASFQHGYGNAAATFTVGSGGLSVISKFYPANGSITLNGNITVGGNILGPGIATFSGTGKVVLTDAAHIIIGPVNLRNLQIATLTAPRTIAIAGSVTTTGTTTALNGSSVANSIAFSNLAVATFTPSFTSSFCAASALLSITCNASGGAPTSAPIDLISSEKLSSFSREVKLK
jgi:hypothetical protein